MSKSGAWGVMLPVFPRIVVVAFGAFRIALVLSSSFDTVASALP